MPDRGGSVRETPVEGNRRGSTNSITQPNLFGEKGTYTLTRVAEMGWNMPICLAYSWYSMKNENSLEPGVYRSAVHLTARMTALAGNPKRDE